MDGLDEETQLAIALALSEAEAAGQGVPLQQRGPGPNAALSDADLARELQRQFDQEAAAAATAPRQPPANPPALHTGTKRKVVPETRTPPATPIEDPASCAGCRQPLVAQRNSFLGSLVPQSTSYINALGRSWHPQCFLCTGCRKPLPGQFTVSATGEPYCQPCHQRAFHPRCGVCGDFLPEQGGNRIVWQVTPFWGDKTCPAHGKDGTKRCTACTRLQPRGEQWADLEDGRVLCLLCLGTVIPNTASSQPLYDEILSFYQKSGMTLPARPPLSLVDDPALNTASTQQGPRADGPLFHTRGLCLTEYSQTITTTIRPAGFTLNSWLPVPEFKEVKKGPKKCTVTAILVLAGLPRLLTGCILAHECMHAWLRLSGYEDLPPEVEEGLCQLMALLWLESHASGQSSGDAARSARNGAPRGAGWIEYEEKLAAFLGHQIRNDPSYIYGDGLRAALEAFQKHGLATVLAHVRRAKRLP